MQMLDPDECPAVRRETYRVMMVTTLDSEANEHFFTDN
jgi:hypothetical protein